MEVDDGEVGRQDQGRCHLGNAEKAQCFSQCSGIATKMGEASLYNVGSTFSNRWFEDYSALAKRSFRRFLPLWLCYLKR